MYKIKFTINQKSQFLIQTIKQSKKSRGATNGYFNYRLMCSLFSQLDDYLFGLKILENDNLSFDIRQHEAETKVFGISQI